MRLVEPLPCEICLRGRSYERLSDLEAHRLLTYVGNALDRFQKPAGPLRHRPLSRQAPRHCAALLAASAERSTLMKLPEAYKVWRWVAPTRNQGVVRGQTAQAD